ncbi:hypothetical protein ABK040_008377 [Willaertia magna]
MSQLKTITFLSLIIATLSLIVINSTTLAQQPPIFPSEYTALAYVIDGDMYNENNQQPAIIKITNSWSQKSKRVDYQFLGQNIFTQLHTIETLFEINPLNKTCTTTALGFPPLPPNWLQNATFIGIQKVNGIACETWRRDTSTYWQSVEDKSPVKVNESNFFVWNYIQGSFKSGKQNGDLFKIPDYCKQ